MRARLIRPNRDDSPSPSPAPRPPLRAVPSPAATGGVEDRELYTCSCGITFQALVSASARCPKCGAEQAW